MLVRFCWFSLMNNIPTSILAARTGPKHVSLMVVEVTFQSTLETESLCLGLAGTVHSILPRFHSWPVHK